MIDVQELTKRFGARVAVDALTFQVPAGQTVGFLGPNGAGKSTTMRMLTGFLGPTSGAARIGGHDVADNPLAARRHIGYLPESNPLYRDMRVSEFLDYRGRLKGLARAARRRAIAESLSRCRIADVAGRIVGQLSKGYRQRVGLADCMLGKPALLILDEPTVGLDPNQVQETRNLIRELGEERTVFLSTHILHEVELLCRRVLIINRGRLIADGSPKELRERHVAERRLSVQVVAIDSAGAAPPPEAVRAVLAGAPGVAEVEEGPAEAGAAPTWIVRAAAGTDARRPLAEALLQRGWLAQEMREEPVRLEDIFARLTGTPGQTA